MIRDKAKSSRKRSRGGFSCLPGTERCGDTTLDGQLSQSVQVDVVSLVDAFYLISGRSKFSDAGNENNSELQIRTIDKRRVRIVRPYPYRFGTFAKARWIGRTVLDVYHTEFGKCTRLLSNNLPESTLFPLLFLIYLSGGRTSWLSRQLSQKLLRVCN